jgi:hypothetical protein
MRFKAFSFDVVERRPRTLERVVLDVESRGYAGGGDAVAHVGHCKPPSLDDEDSEYVALTTASTFANAPRRRSTAREHATA